MSGSAHTRSRKVEGDQATDRERANQGFAQTHLPCGITKHDVHVHESGRMVLEGVAEVPFRREAHDVAVLPDVCHGHCMHT